MLQTSCTEANSCNDVVRCGTAQLFAPLREALVSPHNLLSAMSKPDPNIKPVEAHPSPRVMELGCYRAQNSIPQSDGVGLIREVTDEDFAI